MEKPSKALLKASDKAASKDQDKKKITAASPLHTRGLFVGDDTGLLKQLSMSLTLEDDIISMPAERRPRKPKRGVAFNTDELEEEVQNGGAAAKEEIKEEALIRSRHNIEFKVVRKSGEQVKDEGLQYLRWSLQSAATPLDVNTDYISYVRGKSNIVQVFDTLTDKVWAQKKYAQLAQIKGLASIGIDLFQVRHVVVDEQGRMMVDRIS